MAGFRPDYWNSLRSVVWWVRQGNCHPRFLGWFWVRAEAGEENILCTKSHHIPVTSGCLLTVLPWGSAREFLLNHPREPLSGWGVWSYLGVLAPPQGSLSSKVCDCACEGNTICPGETVRARIEEGGSSLHPDALWEQAAPPQVQMSNDSETGSLPFF